MLQPFYVCLKFSIIEYVFRSTPLKEAQTSLRSSVREKMKGKWHIEINSPASN